MLTLEDGRLQASNAVSTRFLSAENKRYILQNENKPEWIGLKTCLVGPCGLKTGYCFPVSHVFSYLFLFAGCYITQVRLMMSTMSLILHHARPCYSRQLFKKVTTALFTTLPQWYTIWVYLSSQYILELKNPTFVLVVVFLFVCFCFLNYTQVEREQGGSR